jgi:hypothetical protein
VGEGKEGAEITLSYKQQPHGEDAVRLRIMRQRLRGYMRPLDDEPDIPPEPMLPEFMLPEFMLLEPGSNDLPCCAACRLCSFSRSTSAFCDVALPLERECIDLLER